MSIRYDKRNKCWRFEFRRTIQGREHRRTKLLPRDWDQAQADAYDRAESARLYAVASGVAERDPAIGDAVTLYLQQRKDRKAAKKSAEHLAAIAFAYVGKPMSALEEATKEIKAQPWSPATKKQRLALLKAACRLAWRKGMVQHDPTHVMEMPQVNNEAQVYLTRRDMLRACRACNNWETQIAARVSFYSGMRLGELYTARAVGDFWMLDDTKNDDPRMIPIHPRVKHLTGWLPLSRPKITIQRAWNRALRKVGVSGVTFHTLRHSAASEMANAGIPLFVIGQVLGHRDGKSTQRYSHLTAGTLTEAVRRIGR